MKKALSVVLNVIVWIFLIFAIIMTVFAISAQNSTDGIASVGGNGFIAIQSGSMEPTIKTGDLIVTKVLTTEQRADCKKDDIITFYADLNGDGNNELNTHRVVDVQKDGGYTYYTTKGDNNKTNPINDKEPVMNTQVVGRYDGTKVNGLGNVFTFLQKPMGFMLVIVVPLVIFFLFELYSFISVMVRLKNKGKVSEEEEEEIKKKAIEEYLKQKENENAGNDKDSDK